ncbi:MAG: M48 family metallopeptidase [Verrucomicrobiae bacterium]|nr:M48 family metallopeptidase [Verrucomicrobiae bacterium]
MTDPSRQRRARRYENNHHAIFVAELVYMVVLLLWLWRSGTSHQLARLSSNPWLATTVYATAIVIGMKLAVLPLAWFADYFLEHRYQLSTQTMRGWLLDEAKSLALSVLLGVVALNTVYFLLRKLEAGWWLAAGGFFLVFGIGLSVVFPVWILPLFYKLAPLQNAGLTARLATLAQRAGVKLLGVYRIALSEKTRKANAALAGLGKTKRIILGDTLLEQFTEDEIEVVMAHELAHHRHRDLWLMLAWNAATIFGGLGATDTVLRRLLPSLGFARISDLAAFPLLALCMLGFGLLVMPLNNAFSRWRERLADAAALQLTHNPDAFIRAMRRLADQNLADPNPPALVEFLLHDHPALARRIKMAEQWRPH